MAVSYKGKQKPWENHRKMIGHISNMEVFLPGKIICQRRIKCSTPCLITGRKLKNAGRTTRESSTKSHATISTGLNPFAGANITSNFDMKIGHQRVTHSSHHILNIYILYYPYGSKHCLRRYLSLQIIVNYIPNTS